MADKNKKLTRVQFERDATTEEIFAIIRQLQDEWARKNPERAHELYPKVYDENGNRIPNQESS